MTDGSPGLITRTQDSDDLVLCRSLIDKALGFETIDLSTDILLKKGNDMALFEKDGRVFTGHYFFSEARGLNALRLASEFLFEIFNKYDALVIKGLTPLSHTGALRITDRLGFTDYGTLQTAAGPMRLSILTKEVYNECNLRRQQEQATESKHSEQLQPVI